jgi:hypothetical protein
MNSGNINNFELKIFDKLNKLLIEKISEVPSCYDVRMFSIVLLKIALESMFFCNFSREEINEIMEIVYEERKMENL